jgi:hypothetical protein
MLIYKRRKLNNESIRAGKIKRLPTKPTVVKGKTKPYIRDQHVRLSKNEPSKGKRKKNTDLPETADAHSEEFDKIFRKAVDQVYNKSKDKNKDKYSTSEDWFAAEAYRKYDDKINSYIDEQGEISAEVEKMLEDPNVDEDQLDGLVDRYEELYEKHKEIYKRRQSEGLKLLPHKKFKGIFDKMIFNGEKRLDKVKLAYSQVDNEFAHKVADDVAEAYKMVDPKIAEKMPNVYIGGDLSTTKPDALGVYHNRNFQDGEILINEPLTHDRAERDSFSRIVSSAHELGHHIERHLQNGRNNFKYLQERATGPLENV